MADNVAITAGSGTTIAADDVAGVLFQRVKLTQGADGSATDVSSAAPLQVTGANGSFPVTNTGTFAVQSTNQANSGVDIGDVTINNAAGASAVNIQDGGNSITVDGTVAVSGTVTVGSHAVTNAGTFATQESGALLTAAQLIDDAIVADNAGFTDGTTKLDMAGFIYDEVAGTALTENDAAAARINVNRAQVATIEDGATRGRYATVSASNALKVDGSAVTQPVSIATNTPVGNVAHDAADSGAPIKMGGRARSSEITAVANDDRSDFVTDLVGKQIVLPYANTENIVSGAITTSMTGTTSTSLIAAPAAGLRNYITTIIVSNAHATVGTDVIIQDGNAGTTLMTIPAAAVYGGAVINLPVPLRQPTTATAIFCANVTTGASTKVSAVGFIGR